MKHLCISASNVRHKRKDSASTKTCELIKGIIKDENNQVEILKLMDYKLKPCKFCGSCIKDGYCTKKDDFNKIFEKIKKSDFLYFVIPHYSIIPSKLSIIFEKINEIFYTGWINDNDFEWELKGKKAFIIAHGGSNLEENPKIKELYNNNIVNPMIYLLKSLGLEVEEKEGNQSYIFGIKSMKVNKKSIFPDMIHDWEKIEKDLKELFIKNSEI